MSKELQRFGANGSRGVAAGRDRDSKNPPNDQSFIRGWATRIHFGRDRSAEEP